MYLLTYFPVVFVVVKASRSAQHCVLLLFPDANSSLQCYCIHNIGFCCLILVSIRVLPFVPKRWFVAVQCVCVATMAKHVGGKASLQGGLWLRNPVIIVSAN